MSSNSITTQRVPPALYNSDDESNDREQQITSALCLQLDRVLDELWKSSDDHSTSAVNSAALAQLALRLCRLYPRATPNMKQRIALGEQVLELHAFDGTHGRDVLFGQARARMTRREAALLHYLLCNRDRIISREELMNKVWNKRLIGMAARTVDIHVHRLRRKLGAELATRLETVRNAGYTFSTDRVGDVSSDTAQSTELQALDAQ